MVGKIFQIYGYCILLKNALASQKMKTDIFTPKMIFLLMHPQVPIIKSAFKQREMTHTPGNIFWKSIQGINCRIRVTNTGSYLEN